MKGFTDWTTMYTCELTPTCAFFKTGAGYSPELNHAMKERFCTADRDSCARYRAELVVGRENVPVYMLPTEHDRLDSLTSA